MPLLLGLFLGYFWGCLKTVGSRSLYQYTCCWCLKWLITFIIWFCILPFCWNYLSCLEIFWWNFWIFMSSVNRDDWTSFFSYLYPCNFFTCHISLSSASSIALKSSMDSVQPYLNSDFSDIALRFYLFRIIVNINLSCITFITFRYVPSVLLKILLLILLWKYNDLPK